MPYEISTKDHISFGPFSYSSIFSAYNDSFEVRDTTGIYIPAVYYLDSLGNKIFEVVSDKKGKLDFDEASSSIYFFEENNYWIEGQLEFKNDKDVWITSNTISGRRCCMNHIIKRDQVYYI